ncbi:MAG: SUMF1/EgtB/PvdO family nonheme iron enzyme [Kiritimatiellia bacterium]
MKRVLFCLMMFSATIASAAALTVQQRMLVRQVERLDAPALTRFADDWEATYGVSPELTSLRALVQKLPAQKQAALQALQQQGHAASAQALVLEARRGILAQPMFQGMELLAMQYDFGDNARRVGSPAQASLACYNMVEANRNQSSHLVKISNLTAETPLVERLYDSPNATVWCVDLHWDATRVSFVKKDPADGNRLKLWELRLGEKEPRRLTPAKADYDIGDGCYLPDGRVIVTSTAAEQGLPCESGRLAMTNTYRCDPVTEKMERLTFDQDSNWSPSVMDDGKVMYVRWEYCDLSHFFSRIIMTMRPDGTRQLAYFGSNGFWPNHYGDPLPIPGANGQFICVATGHHSAKTGRLALFNVAKGRAEKAGCVQMIPGWGKPIPERIEDYLYSGDWPKFLTPFPLGTNPKKDGAGKFFLAAMRSCGDDLWGIYLVDIFDNMTLLCEVEGSALTEPIRFGKRPLPPIYPDSTIAGDKECTVHIADIYNGPGLRGVPRGTVKEVRVFAYHYAYNKSGSHEGVGTESSWDMKYVLGTAPVQKDGSVYFKAPAHTPLAIQPLDEKGASIQLMRSWFVGMPGEHVACTGCHESANSIYNVPPLLNTQPPALEKTALKGRAWSFMRDVQPILTRRCSGCHNDETTDTDMRMSGRYGQQSLRGRIPNFANIEPTILAYRDGLNPGGAGAFTRSYHDLNPYVRRPGPESDNHLLNPNEYNGNSSPLIQILRRGHHGVTLTEDEWKTLYTWIDLNAPFWGTWSDFARNWANEFHRNWIGIRGPEQQLQRMNESRSRRVKWAAQTQVADQDSIEDDSYGFDACKKDIAKITYEPPKMAHPPKAETPLLEGWPLANVTEQKVNVDLPGGALTFLRIPAGKFIMGDERGKHDEAPSIVEIKKSFLMADVELPLQNWNAFDPDHYNGYIDMLGKDHTSPGISVMNNSWFPTVRVSWDEAVAYCAWLSKKTGKKFRLPTEAEWEWAARGGTDTPFYWGGESDDFGPYANLADKALDGIPNQRQTLNYYQRDMRYDDGQQVLGVVGKHRPNPFGLKDIIGNAAEWTSSAYRPYPFAEDGRDAIEPPAERVVRGGAWDLLPRFSRVSLRVAYPQWQRVANVGIRLVCEE